MAEEKWRRCQTTAAEEKCIAAAAEKCIADVHGQVETYEDKSRIYDKEVSHGKNTDCVYLVREGLRRNKRFDFSKKCW